MVVALCNSLSLTMMARSRADILKPFVSGNALKVISGLNNFDETSVKNVARAAFLGGASHVDVACDANLVRIARVQVGENMPIMVSSIVPEEFLDAVAAG